MIMFLLLIDPGTERYLMSFVVRDSPTCFVNATCWGSENYIKDLSRSFGIGDTGNFHLCIIFITYLHIHSKAYKAFLCLYSLNVW